MSFEIIKACARKLGLYRFARRIHRNILNREELHAFQAEVAFYSQFIEAGALCFDVGANYGTKSEIFLKLGANVVAFEPQPDCFAELNARIGSHPRLVALNSAVGNIHGDMELYVEKHRTASSFIMEWQGEIERTIKVSVTTLDKAIAKYGVPQFCKIDVEGFELEVFKGLSKAIPNLSFEYHLKGDGIVRALACLEYLSRFGELRININPAETPIFASLSWWSRGDFSDFFSQNIPKMSGYEYGDIFVKIM